MNRDYFACLGVPRRLNLDPALLEQRFRTLSRQHHPDFFYNAPPAERRASLERSSELNDAYRTLKSQMSRIEHMLQLEGAPGDVVAASNVPASLLEEVFALNEELEAVRHLQAAGSPPATWMAGLERARKAIEARRGASDRHLESLADEWDAVAEKGGGSDGRRAVVEALRERMLERNYLSNLLAEIERTSRCPARTGELGV